MSSREGNAVRRASKLSFVLLVGILGMVGCGDLLTEAPSDADLMDAPFAELPGDLNAVFVRGDENFERVFTVSEGLGPIFNNSSCGGCHPSDGRGTPTLALTRISRGDDLIPGLGGAQHQDKAVPGVRIETLPDGANQSRRLPPPVFGMGVIEAIPADTILSHADEDDTDGDGISGRPNWVEGAAYVPAHEVGGGGGKQLGRFGRKANVSALIQQVTQAYHQDMGITSAFLPIENNHPQAGGVALGDAAADPEISAATVLETVMYVRLLSPPGRGKLTDDVKRGEQVFTDSGCAKCHIPTMETGVHWIPQLSNREAPLYSDLLLHDMGEELADNRPDGTANGREWRTAPLWGTRLAAEYLGGTAYYLHDGRATDLSQAIRLHGGEGQKSRDVFVALPEADRKALLAFLQSL